MNGKSSFAGTEELFVTIRTDVLTTVAIVSTAISEGEQAVVERLVEHGYSRLRAEVLLTFVPIGLCRAVIARLCSNPPLALPNKALIKDYARDRTLEVQLDDVPEFVVARELGEETYINGVIPRAEFQASCISVELNLINQALNAGSKLGGLQMAPQILLRLADAPGFEEWYEKIRPNKRRLWQRQ